MSDTRGPRGPPPCVNSVVCQGRTSRPSEDTCCVCGPWFHRDGGLGFGALDIQRRCGQQCPICAQQAEHFARLPQCAHQVCAECFRDIMFWREERTHLNPVDFGCHPCPNACSNPSRGWQCYCPDYEPVLAAWELAAPQQFLQWREAERHSAAMPLPGTTYGNRSCPFCRTKYDRRKHAQSSAT
jgi:hypothetical protein